MGGGVPGRLIRRGFHEIDVAICPGEASPASSKLPPEDLTRRNWRSDRRRRGFGEHDLIQGHGTYFPGRRRGFGEHGSYLGTWHLFFGTAMSSADSANS